MPNVSNFGAQTDNAVVQGTVTDRAMVIPDIPPQGLMSVGPRVTPNFVKPSLWSALTTYHFFDAVHDTAGSAYVATRPVVPAGTPLTDEDYWFLWADPDARFDELNETVKTFNARIKENKDAISQETVRATGAETEINNSISKINENFNFNVKDFGAIGDGSSDDTNAFKTAINAAFESINKQNVIFSHNGEYKSNTQWQANLYIPSGTYKVTDDLTIPSPNGLTKDDMRVCGLNIIGQAGSIIDFSNKTKGFKIDGSFFKCKNVQIQNALTAFDFSSEEYCPYVTVEDVIIKSSENGIKFNKGTYMSKFSNVIGIDIKETFIDLGKSGTSTIVEKCYSNGSRNGYKAGAYTYTSFISCASDGGEVAYKVEGSELSKTASIEFISCGAEFPSIHFIELSNLTKSAIEFNGFDFINAPTTVENMVHIEACILCNFNFHANNFISLPGKEYKFINSTASNIVKADISNPKIKLNNSTLVDQTNKVFSYLASIEPSSKVKILNINLADVSNMKLHTTIMNGKNTNQFSDVTIIVRYSTSGKNVEVVQEYKSNESWTNNFTIENDGLYLKTNYSLTDVNIYTESELMTSALILPTE